MRNKQIMGFSIVLGLIVVPKVTQADLIPAGSDYFHTIDGTSFEFPGLGTVPLEGLPIGPGNTDTIVRRIDDADLPSSSSEDTIPIEMVALSLQSSDPVFIPGPDSFFDIFIELDPTQISDGTMTIRHEINWPNDGANTPEGTFDSSINVHALADLIPVGGGPVLQTVPVDLELSSFDTPWTHTRDDVPFAPDQTNFFLAYFGDPFFPQGLIIEEHPGVGVHRAENYTPEPATLMLLAAGGLLAFRRRRRRIPSQDRSREHPEVV